MTSDPFNHVGILVADLAEASARFSAALGLTFTEPIVPTGGHLVSEGGESLDREGLAFCYSYEGPPHIELIQAHGNGLYSGDQGEGFHHLGYRETEVEDVLNVLEANGMVAEAIRREPADGDRMYTAFVAGLHGIRVELSSARRPPILERLAWSRPSTRNRKYP